MLLSYEATRKDSYIGGPSKDKKRTLTHLELLDAYYNEGNKCYFALSPSNRANPNTVVIVIAIYYCSTVSNNFFYYQSSTLGLFPRGKSGHARVRDNVYCATALWSLALAYRSNISC